MTEDQEPTQDTEAVDEQDTPKLEMHEGLTEEMFGHIRDQISKVLPSQTLPAEATTIMSAVVTIDGKHVFSHKPVRKSILAYFQTEDFLGYAADAEVDNTLLANISSGLTDYLHEQSETDELLEWAGKCNAVCADAKVGRAKNDAAGHIIFSITIDSDPKPMFEYTSKPDAK